MNDYHEPAAEMSPEVRDQVRAIHSFMEELEAVDWYNQRIGVTKSDSLKGILKHNMEEEMEHAMMTLEWLRRNMDGWDAMMRTYLFTEGDITELEEEDESDEDEGPNEGDLGLGNLKEEDK